MAGEVGIEPTNAGIKIRCLTTWRLPSGNREFPASLSVRERCQRVPRNRPGEMSFDVRRQHGQSRARGASSAANAANAQASGAGHSCVRRGARQCGNRLRNRGNLHAATPRDRFCRNPRKRLLFSPTASIVSILARQRRRRLARAHGAARAQATCGGSVTGVSSSPMPRTSACSPPMKNGTSAPSGAAIAARSARGQSSAHSRFEREQHARGVGAAAAQACAHRNALVDDEMPRRTASPWRCSACAARTARSCFDRQARDVVGSRRPRRRRDAWPDVLAKVDQREQRLERVIAVGHGDP